MTLPARKVLVREYMGVACHMPNAIACDRVGLAVWLKQPAVAVGATIAGRPLQLDAGAWSQPPRMFAGFLQPAGLRDRLHVAPNHGDRWYGEKPPIPVVTLRIDYGHGRVVSTRLRVPLSAGWG